MNVSRAFTFVACSTFLIPVNYSWIFNFQAYGLILILLIGSLTARGKLIYEFRLNIQLLALALIVLISTLLNLVDYNLYGIQLIKTSTLGVATLCLFILSHSFIKAAGVSERDKMNFLFMAILAGGFNAFYTNLHWLATTGGVISRYNYTPPISGSNGIQLYYMIFTMLFSFVFIQLKCETSPKRLLIVRTMATIAFFNMLTIIVREVWLIFLITLIMFWYINSSKSSAYKNRVALLLFLVIILGFVMALSKLDLLSDIINADGNRDASSTMIRVALIAESIDLFLKNPLFGIGYGSFPLHSNLVVTLSGGTQVEVNSPHNGLILIVTELGLFGLLIVATSCIKVLQQLRIAYNNKTQRVSSVFASMSYSITFLLFLDQFISNSFVLPPPTERGAVQLSFLFWIFFSFAISYKGLTGQKNAQ